MRVLVRLTAVILVLVALFMLYSVVIFTVHPYSVPLLLLISTVVLWIVTIVLGPLAARRLWRLPSTRRALR